MYGQPAWDVEGDGAWRLVHRHLDVIGLELRLRVQVGLEVDGPHEEVTLIRLECRIPVLADQGRRIGDETDGGGPIAGADQLDLNCAAHTCGPGDSLCGS